MDNSPYHISQVENSDSHRDTDRQLPQALVKVRLVNGCLCVIHLAFTAIAYVPASIIAFYDENKGPESYFAFMPACTFLLFSFFCALVAITGYRVVPRPVVLCSMAVIPVYTMPSVIALIFSLY